MRFTVLVVLLWASQDVMALHGVQDELDDAPPAFAGKDMGESNPSDTLRGDTRPKADPNSGGREANAGDGEKQTLPTEIHSDFVVNSQKQKLRLGAVWGMPGLYSSDGQPRDLMLGTAAGRKVYFGVEKNDAWVQADTGHMWLKGSITTKKYLHTFAEGQRLRVGAVWGMPGLYSSDGGNRDMILGTAPNNKIYFGTHREDAWIQSGTGHAWFKGSVTVKNYVHLFAENQRLRVGAVYGMPGLYASDGAARDLILGTSAGKKVYFGVNKQDAYVEAGSGDLWLNGKITANANSVFKSGGKTLRVGAVYDMPGIYSSDGGSDDLSLGTSSGRRVYFGVAKDDAWVQAGTGDMWLKGALNTEGGATIASENQKLRIGAVWGMPGLYASEGESRDMALGTSAGRKIYFGADSSNAWIQAGSGDAFFKGSVTSSDNSFVIVSGQKLQVGAWNGIPGLYSSEGAARDLMLGAAAERKIYIGSGTSDAYFTAGQGSLWTKGSVEAHDNMYVYAENNRLRVGSMWGLPGLYASDGTPRDMIIGTEKNKKIYFGWHREDAWIEAGSGASFFKGAMEIQNSMTVKSQGLEVTVGAVNGIAGVTASADGVARDLTINAGNGKKVFFGHLREDASIETGTGNAWFKGTVEAAGIKVEELAVQKPAVFEDTVTVKKNLILMGSGTQERDLLAELDMLKEQNEMLMQSMSEMRATMETMMSA